MKTKPDDNKEPKSDDEGKFSSSVYDLIKLFRRIGRSIVGLFLLQLGWLSYLGLLNNIAKEAKLSIDWPASTSLEIPLTTIYLAGAIMLLVGWLFYSGWVQVVLTPIWLITWSVLRFLVFVVCWIAILLARLVNIPLLLLTWPLQRFRQQRWRMKKAGGKAKWNNLPSDEKKKLHTDSREKVVDHTWPLVGAVGWHVLRIFDKLYVPPRIGFAPSAGDFYTEEAWANTVANRFLLAIVYQIKTRQAGSEAIQRVSFSLLPRQLATSTERKAKLLRRLFEFDVLLWGNYLDDGSKRLWLSMQQAPVSSALRSDSKNSKESTDSTSRNENLKDQPFNPNPDVMKASTRPREESDLFPIDVEVSASAVVFFHKDILQSYMVMGLVILLALHIRKNHLPKWLTFLDHGKHMREMTRGQEELLRHLAYDIFQQIDNKKLHTDDLVFSPEVLLTRLVSQWVGQQLIHYVPLDLTPGDTIEDYIDHLVRKVLPIAEKCARLLPDEPEHLYRLGAMYCLAGKRKEALQAFQDAKKWGKPFDDLSKDEKTKRYKWYDIGQGRLWEAADPTNQHDDRIWAEAAALMARAMLTIPSVAKSNDELKKDIEKYKETPLLAEYYQLQLDFWNKVEEKYDFQKNYYNAFKEIQENQKDRDDNDNPYKVGLDALEVILQLHKEPSKKDVTTS